MSGSPVGQEGREVQPRTVVQVIGVLDRGGVERRTLEVLAKMQGEPVRFLVCTLTGRRGELAPDYERAGATVVPIALGRPSFPWRFVTLLRRESVDVVHSHVHLASGYVLALAALAGVRSRIAHFNSDSGQQGRHPVLRRVRHGLLRRALARSATAVVGVAPSSLEANWGPGWRQDHRFSVLPSGIDVAGFVRSPARPLRAELGIEGTGRGGAAVIVHLGRADIPTKNRELAVEVVGELHRRGRDVELVFVGRDGTDAEHGARNREALRAMAATHGVADHVRFLGERTDVVDILSSAEALLFTSTREGLPGVLLEAVACGTPVVSSDVPGAVFIAEQLAGVTIVGLDQPATAWADVLAATLDGPQPATAGSASPLAGTVFDLENCVDSYRRLWQVPTARGPVTASAAGGR